MHCCWLLPLLLLQLLEVGTGLPSTQLSLDQTELSAINKDDHYLYAKCNDAPVLSKASLIPFAPVRAEVRPIATFQIFQNITGYRFTNPAGVIYEGITAHSEGLVGTVSMVPAVPIKEHTWFEGYSWRVVYVHGCEHMSDGHIGWAFFCSDVSCMQESGAASVAQVSEPDFIFFIAWSSSTGSGTTEKLKRQPLLLTGNRKRNLTSIQAF